MCSMSLSITVRFTSLDLGHRNVCSSSSWATFIWKHAKPQRVLHDVTTKSKTKRNRMYRYFMGPRYHVNIPTTECCFWLWVRFQTEVKDLELICEELSQKELQSETSLNPRTHTLVNRNKNDPVTMTWCQSHDNVWHVCRAGWEKHNSIKIKCLMGVYVVFHITRVFRAHYKQRKVGYASSQWESTLHCNVVSHWLGAYTKWTLYKCVSLYMATNCQTWRTPLLMMRHRSLCFHTCSFASDQYI